MPSDFTFVKKIAICKIKWEYALVLQIRLDSHFLPNES